jgi:hypothetical protein
MEMNKELEARFDNAMMDVYRKALSECDYKATRFFHMLSEHRGLETARILLRASKVSEGYVALWERKRLDLTVEAVILSAEWHPLFSDHERDIAKRRLADYGYDLDTTSGKSKSDRRPG